MGKEDVFYEVSKDIREDPWGWNNVWGDGGVRTM